MDRTSWLLALALTIAGCSGDPDDGGQPSPPLDAGQGMADSAPAADAGEDIVDSAPAADAGQDAMGPPLDVDACEHMIDGPSQAVTPAASREVDADDVTPSHARWDSVLLSGPSGWQYGYVDLLVEEPGKISIFKGEELSVTIRDMSGNEVGAESIELTACTSMMERHTFDLGAGTYKLELGSFYINTARLVMLRADDAGH